MPPNRSQAQTQEQLPFLPCDDLRPGAEGLLAVMNADVQQLLMLSAPHFWDRLAADDSIVEMLDTFLRFRRRPYDELPQGSDVAAAAAQSEALQQLSCNVFRVLLRMTMPMERGAPPMRERSRLLYDAALLDLPKMMDIAVLYGHDNPQLVSQLVAQAFTMQARYREDLAAMVAVVAANLMEVLGACSDHISRARKDASSAHLPAVLDGLLYFQDVALTLSAFLRAYPPAAQQMLDGDASLLRALGDVYQQLLPPLSRLALAQADGSAAELRGKAAQMQLALLHLVHQLLDRGLLGDAAAAPSAAAGSSGGSSSSAGPASSNSRADPSAAGATLMEGLMCLSHPDTSDAFGLLPALARWYRLDTAVDAAMADGRLALDETQYQYLLAMLGVDTRAQPGRGPGTGSTAAGSQVDAVQLRSLISAVQDVLPELGDGFVAACLLQLGMDSETVLNRVLEDTLPPQLAALDRSAATNPLQAEACQGSGEAAAAGGADADQLPAGLGAMGVYARTRSAAEEWRAERDGRRAHFEPAASSSGRQLRSVPRSTARAFDLRRSDAKEAVKAHAIAMLWQDEYDDEFDDSMEDMVSAGTSSGLAVDDAVERHRSRIGRDPGREPTPDGAPGSSSSSAANGRAPAGGKAAQPVWVLDGKIYNYAKPGARQMASAVEAEATLQLEAQEIHGLGRGGNKAFFAAQHSAAAADPGPAEPAGRGRGGGGGRGRSGAPGRRGRGRGGGGGGAANHHRKDRALRKMAGPPE